MHTFSPSAGKAEVGGLCEFENSQGYIEKSCPRKKNLFSWALQFLKQHVFGPNKVILASFNELCSLSLQISSAWQMTALKQAIALGEMMVYPQLYLVE